MDVPTLSIAILSLSIILQLSGAAVALHHIRLTGRAAGWVCFAAAVSLMAVRRGITLARFYSSDGSSAPDLVAESVALAISVLMLFGLIWLGYVLRSRNVAERERREYAQRFTAAFRLAPSMIILTALDDGEILEVNEAFESITGRKAKNVLGDSDASVKIWRDASLHASLVDRLRNVGSVESTECEVVAGDDRHLTVLLSGERLHLDGRSVGLWQGIDITERKRTEEELMRYRTELEHLVEKRTRSLEDSMSRIAHNEHLVSVGTLAAGIAHQINNPLGSILAATQFALLSEGDEDEQAVWRRSLDTIEGEAVRCGRIVRSVLQFSRSERAERWPEDLRSVAQRAVAATSEFARERSSSVDVSGPEAPEMATVSPIEIEQVVVNVLRNAIESRETGAQVSVEVGGDEESAWIEVSDDGSGIRESDLSQLFDPFFTTRLGRGGTGLGLSVAHGITSAHGGSIVVASTAGVGTQVRIELPKSS